MGEGVAALSPLLVGIKPVITPTPTRLAAVTDTAAMPTKGFIFAVSDMSFLHFQFDIRTGRIEILSRVSSAPFQPNQRLE
jgi:hypothetical protein